MTVESARLEVDAQRAWIGRLECGCVVAVDCYSPAELETDPDLTIEETTIGEARRLLTFAHGRPTCEVLAERDAARAIAVRLEQENAEALRLLEIALRLRMVGENPAHGRAWRRFDGSCEQFVRAARLYDEGDNDE